MGISIRNAAILDLTSATEETLRNIESVENAAVILITENEQSYLSNASLKNVASIVPVPSGCSVRLENGTMLMAKDFPEYQSSPVFMMVNGTMFVENGIDLERLAQVLVGGMINGTLLCPETMRSFFSTKLQVNGTISSYRGDHTFIAEDVTISDRWLEGLEDNSAFSIQGRLTVSDTFMNFALFEQKIKAIELFGSAEIPERFEAYLKKVLLNKPDIIVIPTDYVICPDCVVTARMVRQLEGCGLMATDKLIFEHDVDISKLKGIKANDVVFAPKSVEEQIGKLCDLSTKLYFYGGKLNFMDGESRLTKSELDLIGEAESYHFEGVVTIQGDVSVEDIKTKVDTIFLSGVVICSDEQYGVINKKTVYRSGMISTTNEKPEQENPVDKKPVTYENIAHLKL